MKLNTWLLAAALALACTSAYAADQIGYAASSTNPNTVSVSPQNPLPVAPTLGSSGASSSDASGTVTTGGAYQTVFASSTTRKGCLIQNPTTASEILKVKVGTMAAPLEVAPGGSFSCVGPGGLVVTDAITATAATTSHAFVAVSQ